MRCEFRIATVVVVAASAVRLRFLRIMRNSLAVVSAARAQKIGNDAETMFHYRVIWR